MTLPATSEPGGAVDLRQVDAQFEEAWAWHMLLPMGRIPSGEKMHPQPTQLQLR